MGRLPMAARGSMARRDGDLTHWPAINNFGDWCKVFWPITRIVRLMLAAWAVPASWA
jgi:hypothetical protein